MIRRTVIGVSNVKVFSIKYPVKGNGCIPCTSVDRIYVLPLSVGEFFRNDLIILAPYTRKVVILHIGSARERDIYTVCADVYGFALYR